MNQNEIRKERLLQYVDLSESARSGLVSVGMTAWLLNVCRFRIYDLIESGRLETRVLAGQKLIFFPSVFRFFQAAESRTSKVGKKQKATKVDRIESLA